MYYSAAVGIVMPMGRLGSNFVGHLLYDYYANIFVACVCVIVCVCVNMFKVNVCSLSDMRTKSHTHTLLQSRCDRIERLILAEPTNTCAHAADVCSCEFAYYLRRPDRPKNHFRFLTLSVFMCVCVCCDFFVGVYAVCCVAVGFIAIRAAVS